MRQENKTTGNNCISDFDFIKYNGKKLLIIIKEKKSLRENASHCPFCGSLIEPDSEFCNNCGASLNGSHKTERQSTVYRTTGTPTESTNENFSSSVPPSHQYGATYSKYPNSQTVYVPQESNSSSAGLIALIFGILGCIGCLPGIGSVVAIFAGTLARKEDTSDNIGFLLGWLGLCSFILLVVAACILIPIFLRM